MSSQKCNHSWNLNTFLVLHIAFGFSLVRTFCQSSIFQVQELSSTLHHSKTLITLFIVHTIIALYFLLSNYLIISNSIVTVSCQLGFYSTIYMHWNCQLLPIPLAFKTLNSKSWVKGSSRERKKSGIFKTLPIGEIRDFSNYETLPEWMVKPQELHH